MRHNVSGCLTFVAKRGCCRNKWNKISMIFLFANEILPNFASESERKVFHQICFITFVLD